VHADDSIRVGGCSAIDDVNLIMGHGVPQADEVGDVQMYMVRTKER
jgi:hypothetical protein